MAEKVVLYELEINQEKAIAGTIELRNETERLKKERDALMENEKSSAEERIKADAAYKASGEQLKKQEAIVKKLNASQTENLGTLQRLELANAKLRAEQKTLNLESEEGIKRNKEINKQIDENTKRIKENSSAADQQRMNIGNYKSALEGLPGPLGGAAKAVTGFGGAIKFALGPIGLIITAVGLIVGALTKFFTSSEEGQNSFKKFAAIFNAVAGNISDIISSIGEAIVFAFTKPKEAIADLWEFIKSQIMNRITGLADTFKFLGKTIWSALQFDWDAVADNAKKLGESYIQTITGVDDAYNKAKNAISNFIDEQKREIKIAQDLADRQAALDKKEREEMVLTAKERLELAKIKNEIDDKEKNNGQERIKLIDEENKILDKQRERLTAIALEKYEIKKAQNALSNSTKEDLDEEQKLLAEYYNVLANNEAQRKEAIAKRLEALNQIKSEEKQAAIEAANRLKEYTALEIQNYNDRNMAADQVWQDEVERINSLNEKRREAYLLNLNNEMELAQNNMFARLDLEAEMLEYKRQQEVEFAEKIGADVNLINEKYAKAQEAIDEAKWDAKLALAQGFAGNIATIFGKETAIGKAAAVAETTINTYRAAQSAYASLAGIPVVGPALGITAAAAAVAAGIANVKAILKVKVPGGGGDSGAGANVPRQTGTTGSPSAPVSIAPTVGQGIVSRNTNQLNSSDISLQPVLVIDNVTQKQNADTRRNETATL